MLIFYRALIHLITPLLPTYLNRRLAKGKEDRVRLSERYGKTNIPRPQGKLIWFHAASVGESLSLLKLLETLRQSHPHLGVLVTTGTITSANLMAQRLPQGINHQYVPLDVPSWIRAFLDHWQPQLAVFLESEMWPNTIVQIKKRQIPLLLLNARLSDQSYQRWQRFPRTARSLFSQFDMCLTPSLTTSVRLQKLGAPLVNLSTNLKFTCDPPTFDQDKVVAIQQIIGNRLIWAAASTHEGEDDFCLEAHIALKNAPSTNTIMTLLVPRHPSRTPEILRLIEGRGLTVARRSLGELPSKTTDIWLMDTIGEMGLIYRLVNIAFIGGSLVPVGGHNPIEAVQLDTVILHGPFDANAMDIHEILSPALIALSHPEDLTIQLKLLLNNPEKINYHIKQGQTILTRQNAGVEEVMNHILELLK